MKVILSTALLAATLVLIGAGILLSSGPSGTVGIASGSPLPGLAPRPDTPERSLTILLGDLRRRNWDRALTLISQTGSGLDPQSLAQSWSGSAGSLRTFSNLEAFDLWPLHATSNEAQIRAHLHWSTPVGPVEDMRDFRLTREGSVWKADWPSPPQANQAAQIVPVTYLRWDLVTGNSQDTWGSRNVDAPNVRIISMNAVDSADGVVVLGEVENDDTIPAFVNVKATLLNAAGSALDTENSFDKIAHVLLPKQVSPYRIDFPGLHLEGVKNVHMDVKAAIVPASADPVIGVMNQKIEKDSQGNPVLHGELLNQSGRTVNIPHVIASFSDSNGRVVWVADGYVDRAILPQGSEPFAVQVPRAVAEKIRSFHVVVNQFSLENS